MLIGIDPIAVATGPLAVRWFGVLVLVGLVLAIWLSLRELERQRLGRTRAVNALAWALPFGVVCARLCHVLGYWDYYLTNSTELWQLNLSGLSLWGGLVGGGLMFAARLGRGAYRWRVLDAVVPFVLLGIAIGRLGELVDGQGQGLPSGLPWATQYASRLASTPDFGVARHPVQLYDALVAAALCLGLWLLPRGSPPGTRVAIVLVVYGAAQLALAPIRLDPAFVFGFQIEQLLALGSVVAGGVLGVRLVLRRQTARERPEPAVPAQSAQAARNEGSLVA
jgi:phosphatidylglycerol---prolipoprotein diacylglyceryl transferase